jgi:RimJ/RimL family protein N-acetyltransferase
MLKSEDLPLAPRELLTPRLRLAAPHASHAAAVAESINASLPALRFISWGQREVDLAWATRFCERGLKYVEDGECLIFNVFEQDGGAFVGRIDLHTFDFEAPRAEMGYVGDIRRAGRGLMREAVLAVVQLGFQVGLARIHAISDTRNQRALHFAEACGFTLEGVLRAYERDPWGELCTQAIFATYNPDMR